MNLVDEQNVARLEVREYGGQIARSFDGRAARRFNVRAELVGDDCGKRGLAQTRRAREQDVVGRFAAGLRSLDHDGKRFLDLFLAKVVFQELRPQATVEREVFFLQFGGHGAIAHAVIGADKRTMRLRACVEHEAFYFNSIWHEVCCASLSCKPPFGRRAR